MDFIELKTSGIVTMVDDQSWKIGVADFLEFQLVGEHKVLKSRDKSIYFLLFPLSLSHFCIHSFDVFSPHSTNEVWRASIF